MLVELGIIFSVYGSTRWWQSRHVETVAQDTQAMRLTMENRQALQRLDEHRHHFKLSVAASTSCVVAYLVYPPLYLFNLGLITYSATPILYRAEQSLRRDGQIQNDSYSALVTMLCVGSGQFFAAALHNAIYHLGSRMVEESKEIAGAEVKLAFLHQHNAVWVQREEVEIELPLDQVRIGDVLLLRSGEIVPIDGEIIYGQLLVDQQILTGEIRPVEKTVGDHVQASSLLLAGEAKVRATCGGAETQAHKLEEMLHHTRDYKTETQLKGETWANHAALPLLGASAIMWPLVGFGQATALLFSAPPNTVRALLSLQTSTHLKWAAQQGLLIKDGRVLEELPWIDTVLFDKTGTLTQSRPQVARIFTVGHLDQNNLLSFAAAAEQHLYHPIAAALLDEAQARGLILPQAEDRRYDLGLGVSARIQDTYVQVGSRRFMDDLGAELPIELDRAILAAEGHTFVLVAVDNQVQGAIELYPRLRPEVPQVIKELRERGVRHIGLISGDAHEPCQRMAHDLGLDTVYSEVMPYTKVEVIRGLQSQGRRVCFIGDGLNDALAMKQANVSVCLRSASDLTSNVAQIMLMEDNLSHLSDVFELGAHLHLRLGGSLGFWVGFGLVNAICVPLLQFSPLQSSIIHAGAFSLGFHNAKSPGWLDRPDRHAKPAQGELIVDAKVLTK